MHCQTVNQRVNGPAEVYFKESPPPRIFTLSLHDALPICKPLGTGVAGWAVGAAVAPAAGVETSPAPPRHRSEEHTSELQSHVKLVCRLLLEKKKGVTPA